jgi:hypothetical protein
MYCEYCGTKVENRGHACAEGARAAQFRNHVNSIYPPKKSTESARSEATTPSDKTDANPKPCLEAEEAAEKYYDRGDWLGGSHGKAVAKASKHGFLAGDRNGFTRGEQSMLDKVWPDLQIIKSSIQRRMKSDEACDRPFDEDLSEALRLIGAIRAKFGVKK